MWVQCVLTCMFHGATGGSRHNSCKVSPFLWPATFFDLVLGKKMYINVLAMTDTSRLALKELIRRLLKISSVQLKFEFHWSRMSVYPMKMWSYVDIMALIICDCKTSRETYTSESVKMMLQVIWSPIRHLNKLEVACLLKRHAVFELSSRRLEFSRFLFIHYLSLLLIVPCSA